MNKTEAHHHTLDYHNESVDHHCHHSHAHECPINIHEHEGSIAVSFNKDCIGGIVELRHVIESEMQNLEKTVQEHCGVVGHIKAVIIEAKETTMLSLTKNIVNETKTMGGISHVSFAAIIMGVDEDILHESVESIYDKI